MTNKFNVGDKVVPISKEGLGGLSSSVEWAQANEIQQGFLYVNYIKGCGTIVCHHKKVDYRSGDWFSESDLIPYEKVTKNQRITALEETVAKQVEEINELKLIVAQFRKPSTVVEEALANDFIEFEGKQYKKVDREAREGDVVIFRENTNPENVFNNKTYKVISGYGETASFISELKTAYDVYHREMNRTRENVEVYESIVSFGTAVGQDLETEYTEQVRKEKSPNQLRAEIIEKAKGFVEEHKDSKGRYKFTDRHWIDRFCNAEFIVNEEKRTVVVLLRGFESNKVYARGIAKCDPSDVFNEHIGKAIALGRALGLDVSEFEQAVQPTEVVIGMQVINDAPNNKMNANVVITVCEPGNGYDEAFENGERKGAIDSPFMRNRYTKIINDTNAQYGGVE